MGLYTMRVERPKELGPPSGSSFIFHFKGVGNGKGL